MVVAILAASWPAASWFVYWFRIGVLTALLISVIGAFVLGFRCPRCHRNLLAMASVISSGRPCVCPKCGVSMDEPMEKAPDPK
jgi:hypothetical protein